MGGCERPRAMRAEAVRRLGYTLKATMRSSSDTRELSNA
jgi:hypothetical protein